MGVCVCIAHVRGFQSHLHSLSTLFLIPICNSVFGASSCLFYGTDLRSERPYQFDILFLGQTGAGTDQGGWHENLKKRLINRRHGLANCEHQTASYH